MASRRSKTVKSIEDAIDVLKEIIGPKGRLSVGHNVYEQWEPGNRYESADWSARAYIDVQGVEVGTAVVSATTPAALVRAVSQALRIAIDHYVASQQPRRLTQRPRTIEATAVRRLEHQPAGT